MRRGSFRGIVALCQRRAAHRDVRKSPRNMLLFQERTGGVVPTTLAVLMSVRASRGTRAASMEPVVEALDEQLAQYAQRVINACSG